MVSPQPLRLVIRGDDAGSSRSANLALRECCEHGILRNVSVMVPGPAFQHAVETLAGLPRDRFNLGLHITLSSEWDNPRWGPISPPADVPSLLDANGFFTSTPKVLQERGFSITEALAEINAQLDRAIDAGLPLDYVDEHMGVSWIDPRLREGIAALARRRGLVDAHGIPNLPPPHPDPDAVDLAARIEHALGQGGGGPYLYLAHPTYDDAEMAEFTGAGHSLGEAARKRNEERLQYLSAPIAALCRDPRVHLVRYNDARSERLG